MKESLLANLKAIDPDTAVFGICYQALRGLRGEPEVIAYRWLQCAFTSWPEFSGDMAYPVPCAGRDPEDAYGHRARWSKRTEYGRARRRLLKFLIRRLEDEIR